MAYISPYRTQSKQVAWDYLKAAAAPLFPYGATISESELRIDYPNGGQVRLFGADNPDALRGLYWDRVVLDEYADMHPRLFPEIIRPGLADRQGGAVFIGTPKGHNDFHRVHEDARRDPEWFSLVLRASETGLVKAEELEKARRQMSPDQYAQEFECSFEAAIVGAYWGKEMADAEREGRIGDVSIIPGLPVHKAWDIGIDDPMAIWCFQVGPGAVNVVDYYENSGYGFDHYWEWNKDRGYSGIDWVPHDAKVKEVGAPGGRTRIESMIRLGFKPRLAPEAKKIDGINAARLTIPKCRFDELRCAQGLECLRQYRADYDQLARVFRKEPKHDWTSHGADAFRYLAMSWREPLPEREDEPMRGTSEMTMNEAWKLAKAKQGEARI